MEFVSDYEVNVSVPKQKVQSIYNITQIFNPSNKRNRRIHINKNSKVPNLTGLIRCENFQNMPL